MATFLFDEIIFGPVQSRRLGVSLGVNLLPTQNKVCNFNCIYCECGWNGNQKLGEMPTKRIVTERLQNKLKEMQQADKLPDVITFAGNGEPTIHPEFAEIIDNTIELRNTFCPDAKIAVLSNATMLHSEKVVGALNKIERPILKLDSAIESTQKLINQSQKFVPVKILKDQFKKMGDNLIIQTLFLKADYNGQHVDNTNDQELDALYNVYKELNPKEVMIYCVARDTPLDTVYKIDKSKMDGIAETIRSFGIKVSVSY